MGAPVRVKRSFRLSTLQRSSQLKRTIDPKRMSWPLVLFILAAIIEYGYGAKHSKRLRLKHSVGTKIGRILSTSRDISPVNASLGEGAPSGGVHFNIVNGTEADIEEFPFYAFLTRSRHFAETLKTGAALNLDCGASLIHPKFLITAWHCFKYDRDPKDSVAVFHLTNRCQPDVNNLDWRLIQKVHYYPGSITSSKIKRNDLVLLELEQEVTDVSPVLLPKKPPIVGTVGTIIGFGRTVHDDPSSVPCRLLKTFETVEAWKKCVHKESVFGSFCGVATSTIACRGDSGGPWLTWNKGEYELQGIVSFGASKCDSVEANDHYTNVYAYLTWITETISYVTTRSSASQLGGLGYIPQLQYPYQYTY